MKTNIKLLAILLCTSLFFSFTGKDKKKVKQKTNNSQINWLTIEQAEKLMAKEKRPILIDLFTDWCGWCKVMDKKTYSNDSLIKFVNSKYYMVKFNAEDTGKIIWKGKTYQFMPQYKTHELAIELLSGRMSYPSTLVLPVNKAMPVLAQGMQEVPAMEALLKYVQSGAYPNIAYPNYSKDLKLGWK